MEELDYKYFILHKLYRKLYGLALLDKKNKTKWLFYENTEEGCCTAELKETRFWDVDSRVKIHYMVYLKLKEEFKNYNIGDNGRVYLFEGITKY